MPDKLPAEHVKTVCKMGKRKQCPYILMWEGGDGVYPTCAYGVPALEMGVQIVNLITLDAKGMPKLRRKPKIAPNCTGHRTNPPFQPFRKN
ncbi:MAG: hypothetical protein AAB573_01430 [Patescibacteria group bacterium]